MALFSPCQRNKKICGRGSVTEEWRIQRSEAEGDADQTQNALNEVQII